MQRSVDSVLDPRKVTKSGSVAGTRTATDISRRWQVPAAAEEPVRQNIQSGSRSGSVVDADMSAARWVQFVFFFWRQLCVLACFLSEIVPSWWYTVWRFDPYVGTVIKDWFCNVYYLLYALYAFCKTFVQQWRFWHFYVYLQCRTIKLNNAVTHICNTCIICKLMLLSWVSTTKVKFILCVLVAMVRVM